MKRFPRSGDKPVSCVRMLFTFLPWTTWSLLRREIRPSDRVIDLGCGPDSRLQVYQCAWRVGVDIFDPYLRRARESRTHGSWIKADIRQLQLKDLSFDVVVAFDVLDHMMKSEAVELIQRMKRWARRKVIVTVSNGHIPAPMIDGNPYMLHRAGFTAGELRGLGFRVRGMGFQIPGYRDHLLVKGLTLPVRWLTYYFLPSLGYDLLAVCDCREGVASERSHVEPTFGSISV